MQTPIITLAWFATAIIRCVVVQHSYEQDYKNDWYIALNLGICLNCLSPGHSLLTCISQAGCFKCGTRHNSLMCPQNPHNN